MKIVWGELGVYERDKKNGGFDKVKEYYKDGAGQSTLHPIDNAWCSSFANWAIIKTNEKKGTKYSYIPLNSKINNPAGAINWYNSARYPGGKRLGPTEKPPYGTLLIMKKKTGW